jgi:hypothetical protein
VTPIFRGVEALRIWLIRLVLSRENFSAIGYHTRYISKNPNMRPISVCIRASTARLIEGDALGKAFVNMASLAGSAAGETRR